MTSAFAAQIQQLARAVRRRPAARNHGAQVAFENGLLNESAIFQFVLQHGPVSRTEIGAHLGMSRQTVARHVRNLAEQGRVRTTRYTVEAAR